MLRKRYYILFVARDEDGRIRKIPLPLQYAYGFVAAALVGAFTIVALAGSYTRMLLKAERVNQVLQDRENLRKDYKQMAQIAHDRDVQVASLGALANEVASLYGLKQSKLGTAKDAAAASAAAAPTPTSLAQTDDVSQQQVKQSIDQFYALRTQALNGRVSRALESGLTLGYSGDWTQLADAPSMWPIEGPVTSTFGEREDPFNGEGAFHSGVDISSAYGRPIIAPADGVVTFADFLGGYGKALMIDHGHGISTRYGHLSGFAVTSGEHVHRGDLIGYVGLSGRSTGPHLHYEVRINDTPVNPYKYLRMTVAHSGGFSAGS